MEALSKAGDSNAMHNLGMLLLESGDTQGAQKWWERAAEAGHHGAMWNLGLLIGKKDIEAGRAWLRRSAEALPYGVEIEIFPLISWSAPGSRGWHENAVAAGDTDAMFHLGMLRMRDGMGTRRSLLIGAAEGGHTEMGTGKDLLIRAAEGGHTDAMFRLGVHFKETSPPDYEAAQLWLERAANAGHIDAALHLGLLLISKREIESARGWIQQAAERDQTPAIYLLYVVLAEREPESAGVWLARLESVAEAGDAMAMHHLGQLPPELYPKSSARKWLERAAEAGIADSMLELGEMLAREANVAQALKWYERAANVGRTEAMLELARRGLYDNNPATAHAWYERAAEANNLTAIQELGALYLSEGNLATAATWWERGAEAGKVGCMLGLCLLKDEDPVAASRWLKRIEQLAQAGDPSASSALEALSRHERPQS